MDSTWRSVTVAELQAAGVLLVEDGNHGEYRPRPHEFDAAGIAFIRAADMSNGRVLFDSAERISGVALARIRKGVGRPGDILLSHKGTVGKLAMTPLDAEPFVCSPQTTFWRVLDQGVLDRGYLFSYLRSHAFTEQLRSRKGETDMADYVSLTSQRGLRVLIPPIAEQRAIAHILGTLDDKIELNRRMNHTLEEMARALFTSWFVDFDPVRAKAEGRQPEGMDAETAALFPSVLETVDGHSLPSGWRLGTLADIAQLAKRSVNPAVFSDEMFDHYSIPAFDNDRNPARETGADIRSNKTLVEQCAVLISKLNPHIPRVWLPDVAPDYRSICSTEFLVVIPHQASARPFVYSLLTSDAITHTFASLVTGTTGSHQRVGASSLLALRTVIPPERGIARYAAVTRPLFERITENRREAKTLSQLRDTLLPELLSGAVRLDVCAR